MKITDLPEFQAEAIETAKIPIAAFNQSEWVNKYLTPDILWTKFFESKVSALVESARSSYYFGTGSSSSGSSEEGSGEGSSSSLADLTDYYTKDEVYNKSETQGQIQQQLTSLSGFGLELIDNDNVVMGRYSYKPNQGVQTNANRQPEITYIQIPVYFNTSSVLYKLKWANCEIQPTYSNGRYNLGNLDFVLDCTGYGTADTLSVQVTCSRSWEATSLTLYDSTATGLSNTTKAITVPMGYFVSDTNLLAADTNNYITINITIGDHNEILTFHAGLSITLDSTYYITGTQA